MPTRPKKKAPTKKKATPKKKATSTKKTSPRKKTTNAGKKTPTRALRAAGPSMIGKAAPAFELQDQDGKVWESKDLTGKPYVVYFYPKDDTPGCTKEACGIRDHWAAFKKRGIPIFGVSADTVDSHRKFADKYNLPFPLLADPDRRLIEAYGAWREKNMYGRKYMGIARTTFIVGADGKVVKEWQKVKPEEHAEEILAAV